MDANSSTIDDAIEDFSKGVKNIKNMKMEMIEMIATQMFQNEYMSRELIVQGQLQMVALFA
jgi:hypothetical protein